MKWNTIKYTFKEGIKNVFLNRAMSLASISVIVCCMVLTGSAVLLSTSLSQALKSVENKNSITVFLKKEVTYSKTFEIGEKIKEVPNVLSCEYYSSDQASEKYREVLGELYAVLQKAGNPFPEAFHVTMNDLSKYKETVEKLELIEGVDSVSDRSETAQRLSELSKLISNSGIWTVCLLGLISMFIIMNTIRLTMHNHRLEISIMKSVGATNSFICAPFIVEGVVIGIVSAIISSFILNFVYKSFVDVVGSIISFYGNYSQDILYGSLIVFSVVGFLLGTLGSTISIRRYLKKEGCKIC